MWLGRYRIGDRLGLSVLSKSKSGAPVQPSALVQAFTYDSSGAVVEAVPLHPKDRFGGNWDFTASLKLSASYTPGHYSVVYQWAVSAALFSRLDTFEVLSGGDADGQVIALASVPRPEANFVLYQTEAGDVKSGRNPS